MINANLDNQSYFLFVKGCVQAHSLLQLVLRVRKGTVGSPGTAALLTKVSAHAGLVLAVGLRLQNARTQCALTVKLKECKFIIHSKCLIASVSPEHIIILLRYPAHQMFSHTVNTVLLLEH